MLVHVTQETTDIVHQWEIISLQKILFFLWKSAKNTNKYARYSRYEVNKKRIHWPNDNSPQICLKFSQQQKQ